MHALCVGRRKYVREAEGVVALRVKEVVQLISCFPSTLTGSRRFAVLSTEKVDRAPF